MADQNCLDVRIDAALTAPSNTITIPVTATRAAVPTVAISFVAAPAIQASGRCCSPVTVASALIAISAAIGGLGQQTTGIVHPKEQP